MKKILLAFLYCFSRLALAAAEAPVERSHVWVYVHGTKEFYAEGKNPFSKVPLLGRLVKERFSIKLKGMSPDHQEMLDKFPGFVAAAKIPVDQKVRRIDRTLCENRMEHCTVEHFYYFTWDGKWSDSSRKEASQKLKEQLVALKERYFKQGKEPVLHILTHSYGGDVVLKIANQKGVENLVIDELVLLACPIRDTAIEQVKDSRLFRHVFNIYSSCDRIQCMDVQGAQKSAQKETPWFVQRSFPIERLGLLQMQMPDELELRHKSFLCPEFLSTLPTIVSQMKNNENKLSVAEELEGKQEELVEDSGFALL